MYNAYKEENDIERIKADILIKCVDSLVKDMNMTLGKACESLGIRQKDYFQAKNFDRFSKPAGSRSIQSLQHKRA